ncbi:MAG: hypothetical protein N2312_00495 [Dictyoglomaceae bacterium]|nr:hypothetical protein [Dictyoglomaceae bacterium]
MKRFFFFFIVLAFLIIPAFAVDFGVNYTKEMGGFNRDFFGITIRSVGESFLGFDLQVMTPSLVDLESPMKNVEYLFNNIEDVEYIQILPFLLLNLPAGPITLYGGVAPMIDLLYEKVEEGERQFKFQLFSPYMFYAKVGAQLNLLFLGAYVEAGTILDLTFKSTFEVFHVTGGAVLNF